MVFPLFIEIDDVIDGDRVLNTTRPLISTAYSVCYQKLNKGAIIDVKLYTRFRLIVRRFKQDKLQEIYKKGYYKEDYPEGSVIVTVSGIRYAQLSTKVKTYHSLDELGSEMEFSKNVRNAMNRITKTLNHILTYRAGVGFTMGAFAGEE